MQLPVLLKITQVAEALQVHEDTVHSAIRSGQLRASKVGNQWRIDPEDYKAYLESRKPKFTKRKASTFL